MKYIQYSEHRHSDMPLFILLSGVAHIILAFVVVNFLLTAFSNQDASRYSTPQGLTISLLKKETEAYAIDAITKTDLDKPSVNNQAHQHSGNQDKASHQVTTEPQQTLPTKSLIQSRETNRQKQVHTPHNSADVTPLDFRGNNIPDFIGGTSDIQIPAISATESKLAVVQTDTSAKKTIEPAKQQDTPGNEYNIYEQKRVLRRVNDELKKHISYPLLARKRGWAGIVTIGFQFTDNGLIHNIQHMIFREAGIDPGPDPTKYALSVGGYYNYP